jgi:Tol biopolymer transport system component
MKLTGSPVVLDERVATYQGNSGAAAFSVSKTGMIAYRKSTAAKRHVIWRDAMGKVTSIGNQLLTTTLTGTPRFSPNKRDVSFARNDQGELTTILDTATGLYRSVEVGTGVLSGESPIWSPDGTSFLLAALGGGRTSQLFEQRTNAAPSSHTRILNSDETNIPTDWRNEFRLFNRTSLTTSLDVMLLPAPNGSEPIRIAATAAREANGRFSPDSKWIVYESDQLEGRNEIFVQPFPGTISDRLRVSNNGGANAQWSWDGRSIYFLSKDSHSKDSQLMAAGFTLSADGRSPVIGDPVALFLVPEGSTYAPAPDGRFLFSEPSEELPPIIVLTNPFGAKK